LLLSVNSCYKHSNIS